MEDKLSKIGDRTERGRADVGGEGFDHSTLLLQSEPGVVVRGEFRGGDSKADIEGDDPRLGDSKVSRSAVRIGHVQGGSDDKANGEETDGKGADRADPHPQSDIGNRTPTISTSQVGESEGT